MAKSKRSSGVRESGARYRRQLAHPAGGSEPRGGRKLDVLRAEIRAGTEALDRGAFTEVSDAHLERFVGDLGKPVRPRNK